MSFFSQAPFAVFLTWGWSKASWWMRSRVLGSNGKEGLGTMNSARTCAISCWSENKGHVWHTDYNDYSVSWCMMHVLRRKQLYNMSVDRIWLYPFLFALALGMGVVQMVPSSSWPGCVESASFGIQCSQGFWELLCPFQAPSESLPWTGSWVPRVDKHIGKKWWCLRWVYKGNCDVRQVFLNCYKWWSIYPHIPMLFFLCLWWFEDE